ncbi:MAG: hypothetical protein M5U05_17955, partial [Anaerolineales bacterium]|nr:hypothetical protein [Anaerolineales bacterium]
MSVLFIANVGNRDVQVPGRTDLPREARLLGQQLLDEWSAVADSLELPILVKALQCVVRKHSGPVDRVVLVASDQQDEKYRLSDTILLAEVIARLLREHKRWNSLAKPEAISIVRAEQSPADYDYMLHVYETLTKQVAAEQIYDQVYLAVSGGTPAMASMLMFQGIRAFGERALPLYVTPHHAMPISLDIGQKLTLDALIEDLERNVKDFQYRAALSLTKARRKLLLREWAPEKLEALTAVLRYATQRFNFDFTAAEKAIFGADRGLPAPFVTRIHLLADDLQARDEVWLMREEIYGAELDFYLGAYKDALNNVFAFREELLRQLAVRHGAHLIETEKGDMLAEDWLKSEPDLKKYLRSRSINPKRTATTYVFEHILCFRAETMPDLAEFLDEITELKKLADLRNKATHQHAGVSQSTLVDAFGGEISTLLQHMWALFNLFTGKDRPAANPYDAINALILA